MNQRNRTEKPDLLEILGDIFANADDGCTVLQVTNIQNGLKKYFLSR